MMKLLGVIFLVVSAAGAATNRSRIFGYWRMFNASQLGLSRAEFDDLQQLPGLDWVQKGVDVTNDTVSITGNIARLPIYSYTFANAQVWTNPSDQSIKFKVPDQVSVTNNQETQTEIVQDIALEFHEVVDTFVAGVDIGVKYGGKNISAGVNLNIQLGKSKIEMSQDSHVYAGSYKWIKMFDVALYPPGLVPGAINPILDGVLKSLPKKISSQEDKSHYDRFISSFGTHYVVAANMGGKVNHDVYVDSSYYKTQSQSYISAQISLTFHYDLWDINPAHGYMNKSQLKIDENFKNHSTEKITFVGGLNQYQNLSNLVAWQNSIQKLPHYLNVTAHKLSELADDQDVQTTLSNYIDTYIPK